MPPLVLVTVAWTAGLLAAYHWLVPMGVEPVNLILLALIPLTAIVLWREDRRMRVYAACTLAFLLGAFRCQTYGPDLQDPGFVAHYNGRGWVVVEGVVQDYPDVRDTWTNLSLSADTLAEAGRSVQVRGRVLVRAPRYPAFRYGDRLRVSGTLEAPPEFDTFSYRDYLARKDTYSLIWQPRIERLDSGHGLAIWTALYAVKDRARATLSRLLPEPESSLLQGILLGLRSGIPADLADDFNATGTSHLIVISGANIALVVAFVSTGFGRLLGRRRAYWLIMAGIVLYVVLVGADAVVVRAGVMGGLFATALYLGRRSTAYVALFASLLLLTLIRPTLLWDVGLQLSFACTLSLILFTPHFRNLLQQGLSRMGSQAPAGQGNRFLDEFLVATLAAQVLIIPLLVYHFGRLALIAPVANLLVLPVQPAIMALGGAATLLGLVPPLEPLARIIAWVPWLGLAYTTAVVRWLAALPFASVDVSPSTATGLAIGLGLLLGAGWLVRRYRLEPGHLRFAMPGQAPSKILLGASLTGAMLAGLAILQLPDGRLHVAFLDVGQGDATLITTPRGRQILVDGGPSPTALTSALGREMPFWDRTIDLVVMTHPDRDHITGLAEILHRYQIAGWLDSGFESDDPLYEECQDQLQAATIPRYVARAGLKLDLEEGMTLEVLYPPPGPMSPTQGAANDESVVLRLLWGDSSFLFTGDIGAEAEHRLVQSGLNLSADVLKVSHHGSAGSSTEEFLSAVMPRHAVVSAGAGNRFGHPEQPTLDRLARCGQPTILRTDQRGTAEFTTDGHRLWIRTESPSTKLAVDTHKVIPILAH